MLDDADVESDEDVNDESPGMVIVDRRFAPLRRLRFRPRPLRGGGVSGFVEIRVTVGLPAALKSLVEVVGGPVLVDDENPGMPIAEKRLLRGTRVLRLRVGAGGAFELDSAVC